MWKRLLCLLLLAGLNIPATEAVTYAVNPAVRYIINVSSLSYGTMGVGDDGTCDGSIALPCLTLTKALTIVPVGGTIVLNGQSGSPTTYVATGGISATKQFTISAYETGGAKIAGNGSTAAITLDAAAADLRLVGVIVDPSLNNGGAAAKCVDYASLSAPVAFTATNVTFQGWTGNCIGTETTGRANITLTNVTATGGDVSGFLYLNNWYEGTLTITGGSCTITDQNTTYSGCVTVFGAGFTYALSNTVAISGFSTSVTLKSSLVGSGVVYGINIYRVRYASVTGGNHDCLGAPGTWQCSNVNISTSVASGQAIHGATITNLTAYNSSNGGIICGIGQDSATSADWALQHDVIIDGCVFSASASARAGGVHGAFLGGTYNGIIRNSVATDAGINFVDKETTGSTLTANTATGCTSSCFLSKGTTNSTYSSNTITATATNVGNVALLYSEVNNGTGTNSTGLIVTGNTFNNNGASTNVYVKTDASQTTTLSNNSYSLTTGTNSTNMFVITGANYTTCAAYKAAVEASATCNIP